MHQDDCLENPNCNSFLRFNVIFQLYPQLLFFVKTQTLSFFENTSMLVDFQMWRKGYPRMKETIRHI